MRVLNCHESRIVSPKNLKNSRKTRFGISKMRLRVLKDHRKCVRYTVCIQPSVNCTMNLHKNYARRKHRLFMIASFRVNSFMQSLLQRVSFYLHCSLDVNKDKMTPSAAVTACTNSPLLRS